MKIRAQGGSGRWWKAGLLVAGLVFGGAHAQSPPHDGGSLVTSDRVLEAGWWPTKGEAARTLYAGSDACATCHHGIAAEQQTTPMYQAGERAAQSYIFAEHDLYTFQEEGLRYALRRLGAQVTFTVTDGVNSNQAEAGWAFGAGAIGQTFILQKGDAFFEGRLSYYTRLGALDISIGHSVHAPAGMEAALGHAMTADATRRCFACHTTEAVTGNRFEPQKAIPGVHCEACHGPGAAHVAAMRSGQFGQASAALMNPAQLSPADSVDFCGACHRTWADVVMQSPGGIGASTVRFQPYLLENSRCWGKSGDPRITCIACHDPHKPLVRQTMAYDSKCLACHSAGGKAVKATGARIGCKVGSRDCASCHMPRYELAQSHATFTDHMIRVVRTSTPGTSTPGSGSPVSATSQ
jgi:hypothetical protein